jgi:predicted Zn-dependent protease
MLAASLSTGSARPARELAPNYAQRLDHRATWSSFPLKVTFTRDLEYTPERERHALAGFREWEAATAGFVRFQTTDPGARADITVSFDPNTSDGATTNSFVRGKMVRAEMKIGVKREGGGDVSCVAAHEFGHALGLSGHSDDRKDLMYPYHWMGRGCGISARDLNTLATRYSALADRLPRPNPQQ